MTTDHRPYMRSIFNRLFTSETPHGGEGAFEAQIQFRSGYAIRGVVSRVIATEDVPYETLKAAVPSMVPDPQYPTNKQLAQKVMVEHYFDYEDVESVLVVRMVDASKLVGDGPKNGTIILGG